MATKNSGNINFKINMEVDKSGLDQILKPLQNIQDQLSSMSTNQMTQGFEEAADSAKKLQSIINSSWNDKLKQLNLDKFNQSIKKSFGSMSQLKNSLSGAGTSGQAAFSAIATEILNTNVQIKESNKLLDNMAKSLSNTITWSISSGIVNNITGAIQKAYYYTKDLDASLNDIRIVTGDSVEKMEQFAVAANQTSKNLGRSTLDYTKAALSFYQQGLSDEQVVARTQVTLKAQNITNTGSQMVDYLTSVWNGFHIAAENAEGIVDKLAKVADSSASDMSQLAIAMSKVASTASVMGVNVDQLTAQLATVIATTRQAPEAVGTAFKSIYTRLNDIKTGADEAEISLGKYSGIMASLGFNVLDTTGRLRDTGQVMEEIGSRWKSLTRQQQIYLAQTMGGLRQVNQVMSLFENWETYSELLNDSLSAQGTLNQKNDVYLESMTAHIKELRAETERTYNILIDNDSINAMTDALSSALSMFNDYIEGIGGGVNVFLNFGSIVAGIFNKQIAQSIVSAEQAIQQFKTKFNMLGIKKDTIQSIKNNTLNNTLINNTSQGTFLDESALLAQAEAAEKTLNVQKGLTVEQQKQAINIQKQIGLTQQEINNLQKKQQTAQNIVNTLKEEQIIKGRSTNLLQKDKQHLQYSYAINQKSLIAMEDIEKSINKINSGTLSWQQQNRIVNSLTQQIEKESENLKDVWYASDKPIQEFEEHLKIIKGYIDGTHQDSEAFKKSWQEIKKVTQEYTDNQQIDLEKISTYLKNLGVDTSKLIEKDRQRLGILNQQNDALAKQGKHVINLQTVIKGLSITSQILTSAAGAVSTYLRQGATAADKANAVFSGISGTVSALLYAIPGIGGALSIISRAGFSIAQSIAKSTGAFQKFEQIFKSTSEKVEEFNQKIVQGNTQLASDNKNISALKDIREEWNKLSARAGQYGKNLERLSEEEQERYHQLVDTFSSYNNEVIQGYDAQGQAIIANRGQLQQTIDLLEKQKRLNVINTYGDINSVISNENLRLSQPYNEVNALRQQQQSGLAATTLQNVKSQIKNNINAMLGEFDIDNLSINNPYSLNNFNELNQILQEKFNFPIMLSEWLNQIDEETDIDNIQTRAEEFKKIQQAFLDLLNDSSYQDIIFGQAGGYYKDFWVPTDTIDAVLNNSIEGLQDSQLKFKEAENEIKDLEGQIKETGRFNSSLTLTILQNYQEYSEAWDAIRTDENENTLSRLILEYLKSFKYDPTSQGDLSGEIKIANSQEQLLQYGNQYIKSLSDTFDIVNTKAKEAIEAADLENFEGSTEEYQNKIKEIIQSVINQLDQDLLEDDYLKQQISDILLQIFDLSDIQIDSNLNVEDITTNIENSVKETNKQLTKILKEYGLSVKPFKEDFLKTIFNFGTQDVLTIIDNLDYGAFLKYIQNGQSRQAALSKVISEYRQSLENSSQQLLSSFNFNLIFNEDEQLTNKLSKKQKLNEEQLNYLTLLQSEYQSLAKLSGDRSSQQYIDQLKKIIPLIQTRYTQQLKINKSTLEGEVANQQAIINSNASENEKTKARTLLIEKTQQLTGAEWDLQRALKAVTNATEAQLAAEQDVAIQDAKKRMAIPQTIKSAIKNLKDNESLSSDEITVLFNLEANDQNLKNIHQTSGIYSKDYINALSQGLQLQQSLSQAAKQEALSILQVKKARLQASIATLQAENEANKISESRYNWANQQLQSGKKLSEEYRKAYWDVINAYNQQGDKQIETEEKIKEIQEQILQIQQQEYQLKIAIPEQQQTTTAIQLAESFDKLKQSLQEGKELTQQESQSLNDVFDLILEKYPQLEWSTNKLTKTWLAGTDEYKEALKEVEEALNQIVYDDLLEKSDSVLDKITASLIIQIDSEDFDEWVQEVQDFLDLDRQLSIQVKSNADEEFERISDELDNIYKTASKIGENFTVSSADDLKSLSEVFPGILEGIELLEDGTYQLNSKIAQQAISTAQGTIDADAKAVKAQLQNQATLFRTKASIYREIGDAAAELADKEMTTEEQSNAFRTDLSDNLSKVQRINSQLVKDQQEQDLVQSTNAALDSAQKQVEYKQTSTQRQIALSDERTSAQVDNRNIQAQAAKNASQGKTTASPTGHTVSSNDQSIGESAELEPSTKQTFDDLTGSVLAGQILTKQQYQTLRDDAYDQAEFFDKLADDYQNASTLIDLNTQRLDNGLSNILAGKDITGKTTKQKTPDHIDLLNDTADVYHTIDEYVKKLGKDLSFVESQEKKLTGKNLLDNLRAQYSILEKQVKAYETKIKLAEQQSATLRSSLSAQGVLFDSETGSISNYVEILNAKQEEVNAIISYYNSLSKEQQEKYKQVVTQAKADYQQFKDDLDNYDKTINETLPELRNSIQTARDKQIQLAIKNFKIKVDVTLDLSQATRNWNKFKKTVINQTRDDNIVGNIQSQIQDFFSYYNVEGISTIGTLTDQVNKTADQIKQINETGTSSVYGDNKAQALQDLQTYLNSLMTSLEDVETLIDEIKQSFFDMVDKAQDAFDQQREELQLINKLIDHDKKLIQAVYGKDAYDKLSRFYQKQRSYDIRSVQNAKAQKDFWYEQMQIQQAKMANLDKTSNEYKEAEDRLEQLEEHWISAVNNFNSTLQAALDNLTDQYKNKISEIFKNLNDKLTNGKGLYSVNQEWELIKKENDLYLDDVDTLYQVNKFANNFNRIFNSNSKNLRVQRSLSKVYDEQLKYLASKERLTQYDVDRATKILQIQEKRLALEQIRQNKTKLRLRRDSQGNYSYQYVADQDEVLKAIQELDDAKHDLFTLDKEQYRKNLDEIYQLYSDFQQELQNLYDQEPVNTLERQKKEQAIRKKYGTLINDQISRNTDIRKNLEESTFIALESGIKRINEDSHTSSVYRTNLQDQTLKHLFDLYDNHYAERKKALEEQLENGEISQEQYNTKIAALEEEALGHSKGTYDLNKNAFYTMSQDMKNKIMGTIVPEWTSGVQEMADIFTGNGGFEPTCKDAFDELTAAAKTYEQGINELTAAAGVDLEALSSGYDNIITQTETLLRDTDQLFNEYAQEMNTVQGLIDKVNELVGAFNNVKQAAIDAAEQANKLLTMDIKNTIQAVDTQGDIHLSDIYTNPTTSSPPSLTPTLNTTPTTSTTPTLSTTPKSTGNELALPSTPTVNNNIPTMIIYPNTPTVTTPTPTTSTPTDNRNLILYPSPSQKQGIAAAIWFFKGAAGWGDNPFRATKLSEKFSPEGAAEIQEYINLHAENGDLTNKFWGQEDYLRNFFYQKFDTGGYTGVWNSRAKQGKLAILHEKELVLNQSDTENILQAVRLVRTLSEQLQDRLLASYTQTYNYMDSLMRKIQLEMQYSRAQSEASKLQTVYITADFPAVNTSRQIEMAFADLTNRASQYINSTTRKRRGVMK